VAEDKIDEETYSLILSALKHPLRRKILRMLRDKPCSFSELLEVLSIDSGHLNYHIKSMGDIITHTQDGKYALSSIGVAAIELMGKVEEQDKKEKTRKRTKRISRLAIFFSIVFATALLTATAYAVTFTTQDQISLFKPNQETETVPVRIAPGQIFSYNITLRQLSTGSGIGYSIGQQETLVNVSQTRNDFSKWIRYFSNTELRLNGTYDISIGIFDPNGNVLADRRESGVISSLLDIPLNFEFVKVGTYRLTVENLRGEEFNAAIVPMGNYVIYEKPLFSYGIAGVVILGVYPVLFVLAWKWNRKRSKKRMGDRLRAKF
jgi:DNA-binding transcriptional ArsR family regulator